MPTDPPAPVDLQPPLIEQLPDRRLVELARASNPDIALTSLGELVRRDLLTGTDIATELVLGHGSDRVRACAALVLGHSDRDISRAVLRRALDTTDPAVLRRVAHALGRIGTPDDLDRLAALPPRSFTPVGRDIQMARTLIAYRHGVTDDPHLLIQAPTMVNRLAGHPETIDFGVRVRGTKSRVVDGAAYEAPTLAITAASVQTFRCSGQPGGLALDADLKAADLRTDLSRPRLLGALLRERPCLERFGLDAWLLADDRDHTGGSEPWLWLVRPDGTVVHCGRARIADGEATFTISHSRAPYGRPIKVSGSFGRGKLTVTAAAVGDYGPSAAQPRVPQPARMAS